MAIEGNLSDSKEAQPPKNAATVVILRPGRSETGEPEIFMCRRSAKSKFMPDALVFPGGKVDAEDGPEGSDEAFLQAARRECQEEAALDLTERELHWFDTWLTPSMERRRFTARFYFAVLEKGEGHEAQSDEYETHEGRWASPREFLARWEREEVDLPPPTVAALMRLHELGWHEMLLENQQDLYRPILPKIAMVEKTLQVVLPHDPEYCELTGEGCDPIPERVRTYPKRYARRGNRWIPITD